MDGETQRQIAELQELGSAHRSRLQVLEIQNARAGNNSPPEVVTEIAEIKAKLVPIDAAIFKLTYVGELRADTPENERNGSGDKINRAVERSLERQRRATVASQIDHSMLLEVRLEAALAPIRTALYVVGGIAATAVIIAIILGAYLIFRGTL